MKKWNVLGIFNAISISLIAQDTTLTTTNEGSPATYLIIGVIVLILVIYILYSRQKRKFND